MNDGGPAFATPHSDAALTTGQEGMSLRDWFAGQFVGHLLLDKWYQEGHRESTMEILSPGLATDAYCLADAMIAERERRK